MVKAKQLCQPPLPKSEFGRYSAMVQGQSVCLRQKEIRRDNTDKLVVATVVVEEQEDKHH